MASFKSLTECLCGQQQALAMEKSLLSNLMERLQKPISAMRWPPSECAMKSLMLAPTMGSHLRGRQTRVLRVPHPTERAVLQELPLKSRCCALAWKVRIQFNSEKTQWCSRQVFS